MRKKARCFRSRAIRGAGIGSINVFRSRVTLNQNSWTAHRGGACRILVVGRNGADTAFK